MDSDPPEIPVQPIPFAFGLKRLADSIAEGRSRIVAIGSSTTAGEGNIPAYPGRLLSFLQAEYPHVIITLSNKGVGGEEAPKELQRFDTDVFPANPDLVIWQVGTNAVWQPADQHPPSFEDTTDAIRDGLVKLRERTRADVILMDLQYVPAVLTPAKKDKAIAMVKAIGDLAQAAEANVFQRFALMKSLNEIEQISFDRLVDPTDSDRLHDSDWVTNRLAWAMTGAIADGVKKAQSASAAKTS
jgi:lysophospholipase L1-like esterase